MSLEVRVRELEDELQKAHQTIANLSKALSESTGYQNVQIHRKLDVLIENGKGRTDNEGKDISDMRNAVMEMVKMQNESHYVLMETLEKRLDVVCGKTSEEKASVKKAPAPPPPSQSLPVDSLTKKMDKLQATVDRIEGKISGQQKDSKDRLIGMTEKIDLIKKSVGEFGGKTAMQPTNPKIEEELNIVKKKLDELRGMAKNSDNALMQQLKSQLGSERKKSEKNSQLITQMHTVIKDIGAERTKQKETENKVTKILKGPLASFKSQVTAMNDKVRIGNKTLDIKEFESAMQSTPWIAFPDGYVVECWDCEEIISLECLWEDGVSADCPKCERLTLLRQAKQGHEWIFFNECSHYQEVKLRSRPHKCGLCAKEGSCEGNQDAFIRIPEISRTPKTYYNRYGIENIMHTVNAIKDKTDPENDDDDDDDDEEEEQEGVVVDEKMITCAICCEIFHRPVSINPCNHKFCAGCIYEWMSSSSTCPTCRRSATPSNTGPDAFVSEVTDSFLLKFPARKRDEFVLAELDERVRRLQPYSQSHMNIQRNNTRRAFFGW